MAELATLARPYAEAVFDTARESEDFALWSETLSFLTSVLENPMVNAVIAHPRIDKNTVRRILLDICESQMTDIGVNLVKVLMDNDKLSIIPHIAFQYERLRSEYQGYVEVEIASAYPVTPVQQQQAEAALQRRLGKGIVIKITIDNTLIGGWLIRIGDQVIDLSIRGRLQQLANACEVACRSV
jgi:F-type H+-transporting ATPase subunit delta